MKSLENRILDDYKKLDVDYRNETDKIMSTKDPIQKKVHESAREVIFKEWLKLNEIVERYHLGGR